MTRLVNFGLGEVCDRVSILALKILYGEQKAIDTTHFRNERNALLTKMTLRDNGRWLEHLVDLGAVNAALWHTEDQLRQLRGVRAAATARPDVVDVAFRIQELNDRRAELIGAINALVGDKTQEKV